MYKIIWALNTPTLTYLPTIITTCNFKAASGSFVWVTDDKGNSWRVNIDYIVAIKQLKTKIRFLTDSYGNTVGDIAVVKAEDSDGCLYYYDSFNRWCYVEASEEGKDYEVIHDAS